MDEIKGYKQMAKTAEKDGRFFDAYEGYAFVSLKLMARGFLPDSKEVRAQNRKAEQMLKKSNEPKETPAQAHDRVWSAIGSLAQLKAQRKAESLAKTAAAQ